MAGQIYKIISRYILLLHIFYIFYMVFLKSKDLNLIFYKDIINCILKVIY